MDKRAIAQDELDYVRDARTALHGDKVKGANLLLFLITGIIVGFVIWAAQAEIDEVTTGEGRVIPSSSVKTIQNLEGGIIADIIVSEGQKVNANDILIRIDDTIRNSNYREILAKQEALQAVLARLNAEATGSDAVIYDEKIEKERPDLVRRETALFEKRIHERDSQIEILRRSLILANEELSMTVPLVQKRIVSKVEQLRLEREVNELQGKLKELVGGFQQDAMELRNEAQAELEGLNEMIKGGADEVRRAVVRSPVTGIVNKIYVSTIGGVIAPGEPIVDIVPEDDNLMVEAKIRPADIAFLRPDQEAVLKFTAYDYSIYGGLKGEVMHISADTIYDEIDDEHYYMIKVRNTGGKLVKNGQELSIIPGMVASVDVLTGRRTVLQYLTKPFHRMRFNAMRER
ncbi:MAG: HlyD family type I secretion periplasmic adaptor subunit [Verrucomicrobiales bacterium]|nr:HlyD family type I secretion periplasmic adaptor subunit [Verrucomicrobiales bacterium]